MYWHMKAEDVKATPGNAPARLEMEAAITAGTVTSNEAEPKKNTKLEARSASIRNPMLDTRGYRTSNNDTSKVPKLDCSTIA